MYKIIKEKEIKFLTLALMVLFFHGCSEETKPEVSDTENIISSYELSGEEKSLTHPIILPGAPGEDSGDLGRAHVRGQEPEGLRATLGADPGTGEARREQGDHPGVAVSRRRPWWRRR